MPRLKITQIRSGIGRQPDQRKTLVGLGLTKMHKTIIRTDTPEIRGMVKKVIHLVSVEEID
jgi:large subunit ribosomal protein L30